MPLPVAGSPICTVPWSVPAPAAAHLVERRRRRCFDGGNAGGWGDGVMKVELINSWLGVASSRGARASSGDAATAPINRTPWGPCGRRGDLHEYSLTLATTTNAALHDDHRRRHHHPLDKHSEADTLSDDDVTPKTAEAAAGQR